MLFFSSSRLVRWPALLIVATALSFGSVYAENEEVVDFKSHADSLAHPTAVHPAYEKSADKTVVGITIPEPSTLGLVGLTVLLITSRHRARRFGRSSEFSSSRTF